MPSYFPEDLFTPTEGSNYGLDGYPDMAYGAGVLDHETLGEPRKPSAVPDGIVKALYEEDQGLDDGGGDGIVFGAMGDITDFVKEAALQDLSWLDFAEQDPSRLPKNPVDTVIPALEEAWGANRQTNGQALTPNIDRVATAYRRSVESGEVPKSTRTVSDINDVLRAAWRRVTGGDSFKSAAAEVARRLGDDAPRATKVLATMKDDAGLIGRVFVRSANYPNCASGRWASEVQKQASSARYLIGKKDCTGCVYNQNDSCAVFRKRIVASVPWSEAARFYGPTLTASGRKLASGLTAKEALRRALAENPEGMQAVESVRPVQAAADAGVDAKRAAAELAAAPKSVRQVGEHSAKQARSQVHSWEKAGALSPDQAAHILNASLSPDAMVRIAAKLVAQRWGAARGAVPVYVKEARQYAGVAAPQHQHVTLGNPEVASARAEAIRTTRQARFQAAVQGKVAKITAAIERGLRGNPLKHLIQTTLTAAEATLAAAHLDPILRKTGALSTTPTAQKAYEGPQFARAAYAAKPEHGPAYGEVQRLLRWARKQMTEGSAGGELDQLLQTRFASTVLNAGSEELHTLRARHEGLSGHIYVDPRAYASKEGTAGCEKGGLRHRANNIPTVLQMPRCATCARSSVKEDGTQFCQVFNKPLVASVPVDDRKAYQAETIRLANGTDADRTAAMFTADYQDDYNLGGETEMDHVVLADTKTSEELGEILFGGGMEF